MASRRVHASRPSPPRPASASPRSRPSAPPFPAGRFNTPGSSWRYRNAVIASQARSCRRPPCSPPIRAQAMPTSTAPWPGTSVVVARIRGSEWQSSRRQRMRVAMEREPDMSPKVFDTSRRDFLQASLATGGGLLLAFNVPARFGSAMAASTVSFAPNAFIRIDASGKVAITVAYVEMGQGTYTSIPMLIAEELEVDLKQVRLEHAPPNEKLYGNPLLGGIQATGNSNAVRASWQPLRRAGAAARTMLVSAAAQHWNVDPASCRAQSGEVIHVPTGRKFKYGELAADAARMPVPESVVLKRPENFKLIGTPAKGLDTPPQ